MPDYLPDPETMGLAEEIAELNKQNTDVNEVLSFGELTEEVDFVDFEED